MIVELVTLPVFTLLVVAALFGLPGFEGVTVAPAEPLTIPAYLAVSAAFVTGMLAGGAWRAAATVARSLGGWSA